MLATCPSSCRGPSTSRPGAGRSMRSTRTSEQTPTRRPRMPSGSRSGGRCSPSTRPRPGSTGRGPGTGRPASARQPGQGVRHAAYDPAYRFVLEMQPAEPEDWAPTTGSDGAVPFTRAGRFEIPDIGGLDVWWLGSYGNGIFVPLRDATAGRTTYGAGRYLVDTVKGADLGREGSAWVLDLNFSYNPSCAYDPD